LEPLKKEEKLQQTKTLDNPSNKLERTLLPATPVKDLEEREDP
jgi:hypothetical protein